MGAPKKWIRALLGLKKSDKARSAEKDENVGGYYLIVFCFVSFPCYFLFESMRGYTYGFLSDIVWIGCEMILQLTTRHCS